MSNDGRNTGLTMIFAFCTGFLTGAVISLLYAPAPGKETRQKIKDTSAQAKDKTLEFAQHAGEAARENVQHIVDQGKESVQGLVEVGKERVKDATDQVKSAVETGKKVSSEVRSKITETVPGLNNDKKSGKKSTEEA
jgi:gas vesicle protein